MADVLVVAAVIVFVAAMLGMTWALAWAQDVRVELTGPGIQATMAGCSWRSSARVLACTTRIPAKVRSGHRYRYDLTVQEDAGTGWHTAPVSRRMANPEVIHFR